MCAASREPHAGVETARCVAAKGVGRGDELGAAYYCVPRDVSQFVREDAELAYEAGAEEYGQGAGTLVDAQFATLYLRAGGRRDVLVTVEQRGDEQTVSVSVPRTGGVPAQRVLLLNTTAAGAPAGEEAAEAIADVRARRVRQSTQ